MSEPTKTDIRPTRPGGCLLEAVRAGVVVFVIGMMIDQAGTRSWMSLAEAALALAALYLLKPRPGWLLGLSTFWFFTFIVGQSVSDYGEGYAYRADLEATLILGIWSTFLAVVLIRALLGQSNKEQQRRLRAAAGYVIPPLEPRPEVERESDLLLRPTQVASRDVLLRVARSTPADPSLLLHLDGEAADAPPVTHAQAQPKRVSRDRPARIERDYVRLAVQLTCAAVIACGTWNYAYDRIVVRPRNELLKAAISGDSGTLERRLRAGARVDTTTEDGRTLLMLATEEGFRDSVHLLLRHGADPRLRDWEGRTALHYAAISTDPALVDTFLGLGLPVDGGDRHGVTPLMYAVRPAGLPAVRVLLKRGARAARADANGEDSLMRAASANLPAIARDLLRAGASARAVTHMGTTALMSAAICCEPLVPDLLANDANVSQRSNNGETALFDAAAAVNRRAVMRLLKAGADARTRRADGVTPLVAACQAFYVHPENSVEVILALLQHGADGRDKAPDGTTAIAYLTQTQQPSVAAIDALLHAHADINAPDLTGETPLIRAIQYHQADSMKLILSRHAGPNVPDRDGITPLMWACQEGDLDGARLLLGAGADATRRDKEGRTALDHAQQSYQQVPALNEEIRTALQKGPTRRH